MRACLLGSLLVAVLLATRSHGADDKPKADPPKEKAKEDKDREVHVVGLYEGYTKSNGQIHGDRAQVLVNRPGKKVILVLVSGRPMTWEIAVNKDTKLEKVILGGSANQAAVTGLPEKTEVVGAFRGSKNPKLPFYTYRIDDPSFRGLVDALDGMLGQKLASFTGQYRAESDMAIVVEDVSNDERLSTDWPKPIPAAKVPKVTFQALHLVPGREPHDVTRSFGEFTLTGPKADTLKPLPDHVGRVVYDPTGKQYFGIFRHHTLGAIDMDKKKATTIDTGLDVPEISWPSGITFDTKRDRVLLTTFGGGGYLYSYTPKTAKWEVLAEKPAHWIAYDAKNDALYGLKGDLRGEGAELQQLNAKGAVVDSAKLDGEFAPGVLAIGGGGNGIQLIAADGKLILLFSPVGLGRGEGPAAKWSYMYLIDPKTGKADLVWKEKVGK
jgi:hypothetical protein